MKSIDSEEGTKNRNRSCHDGHGALGHAEDDEGHSINYAKGKDVRHRANSPQVFFLCRHLLISESAMAGKVGVLARDVSPALESKSC